MKKLASKNSSADKNRARLLARLSTLVARAEKLVSAAASDAKPQKKSAPPTRPAKRPAKKAATKKSSGRSSPTKRTKAR